MGQGRWAQAELKAASGAERWVIVRHRRGWFRLPVDAPVEELLRGIAEGWTEHAKHHQGDIVVRVPLRRLRELEDAESGHSRTRRV